MKKNHKEDKKKYFGNPTLTVLYLLCWLSAQFVCWFFLLILGCFCCDKDCCRVYDWKSISAQGIHMKKKKKLLRNDVNTETMLTSSFSIFSTSVNSFPIIIFSIEKLALVHWLASLFRKLCFVCSKWFYRFEIFATNPIPLKLCMPSRW